MRPLPRLAWHDASWLAEEFVAGEAAMIDHDRDGLEDAIRVIADTRGYLIFIPVRAAASQDRVGAIDVLKDAITNRASGPPEIIERSDTAKVWEHSSAG